MSANVIELNENMVELNKGLLSVVVGSKNPVKVMAAQEVLASLYPEQQVECVGVDAPSKVADQPMTAEETRAGAINRVNYCKQHHDADFYIAIEGGVDMLLDGPATFAYVVIAYGNEQVSVGRSASLPLPPVIYADLLEGKELGPVMDDRFNTTNIKQKGGAIGLLTNGHMDRKGNYTQALTLAMAPVLHPELYNQ